MRKLTLAAAFAVMSLVASAQSEAFKPFKVDFATGYAIPGGSGSKGGVLFAIEPKYAINDNITVGLRMEAAVMARAKMNNEGEAYEADVNASASYLATGDYYFSTERFRPFAGIGVGLFRTAGATITEDMEEAEAATGNRFGFAPRAGFEFGHFRAALEYNAVGKTGNIKNSYIGIKLGFFAGGGRQN